MEEVIALVVGYITVPLVSLAVKRRWSAEIKTIVALALAGTAAALTTLALDEPWSYFATAFGLAFTTQQVAWRLDRVGLGHPSLNEPLLDATWSDEKRE